MSQTQHQIRYVVEGTSEFPIDMLRYDRATPATEADSGRIQASFRGRGTAGTRVTLLASREPTSGRWASFGYKVEPQSVERVPRPL